MAQPGAFLVYTNQPVNLTPIVRALNYGEFGDASHGDIWYPAPSGTPNFVNASPSTIIAHHRARPGTANKRLFVVVDSVDWENVGILGVNLSFEGFIDAARFKANVAGSAIASVSVGNSSWPECLVDTLHVHQFTIYPATKALDSDGKRKESLCQELEFGLSGRKLHYRDSLDCRLATSSPVEEVVDEDVSAIARAHAEIAGGMGCDPELFVVADEADYVEWGVLVGKVGKEGEGVESFRKSVDVAVELLQWIRVGLLTWEEAREWDEEEKVVED